MTIQKDEKTGSTRRKRMTAKRKQEAVKRVDRGESIELVARNFDVTAADTSRSSKGLSVLSKREKVGSL
ncbi:hypothetical protein [Thioalkalivibrio sp. HK1]|uniref:hypothetical protein n=1 Tax=Thioalkalivibrio sp. HK1 TaxID=1469245 RepID=UPI0004AC9CEE|nr:hypothetical protein [Thioalkalivibrio sp. HK1]